MFRGLPATPTIFMLVLIAAMATTVSADTSFVCYVEPPNITLANLQSNFTANVASAVGTSVARVAIVSMITWSHDVMSNLTVYAVTFFFLSDPAAEALGAQTSIQLAVSFNVVLNGGAANVKYETYMAQFGIIGFFAPGLTTPVPPSPTPVPITPAPPNVTNATPVPGPTYTSAPTVTAPNATITAVGVESSNQSVIIGVVFGILGCCAVVGGAIFVLKRFILVKKKAKSSAGGYARGHQA